MSSADRAGALTEFDGDVRPGQAFVMSLARRPDWEKANIEHRPRSALHSPWRDDG